MKVRIREPRLRDAGFNLTEGDTITVPDDVGTKWCGHGWAEDVDGNVPTGERVVRGVRVQPHRADLELTDSNPPAEG